MFTSYNNRASRGSITATIAALLIALSPDLFAQSPLTVQPSTGRVGVGNTTPAEPLDVNGNIKNSGSLSVGTTAQTGTANRFRHLNSVVLARRRNPEK